MKQSCYADEFQALCVGGRNECAGLKDGLNVCQILL